MTNGDERSGRPPVAEPAMVLKRREFLRDVGALAGCLVASGGVAPGAWGALADQPACAFPTPSFGTEAQVPAYSFPAAGPQRVRRSLHEVVADPASLCSSSRPTER